MQLTYSSNNSGGSWWLTDADWLALEAAGWDVEWCRDGTPFVGEDGRYLGALATDASVAVASQDEADQRIEEFERITGQSRHDEGCQCCGRPHYFYVEGA